MTLSILSKKGLGMMSVLDTTVFDESCKDPCGQASKFCGQSMTSHLVRAANQSLGMDVIPRSDLQQKKNIFYIFF